MKYQHLAYELMMIILLSCMIECLKINEGNPEIFFKKFESEKNKASSSKIKKANSLLSFSNDHIYGKQSSMLDKFFRTKFNANSNYEAISNVNNIAKMNKIVKSSKNNNENFNKYSNNDTHTGYNSNNNFNSQIMKYSNMLNKNSSIEPQRIQASPHVNSNSQNSLPVSHTALDHNTLKDNDSEPLLDIITDQTEKILQDICSSSKGLSNSLDQILNEMKKIKDSMIASQHETLSKQKMYVKYTKLVNNLNISISELLRLEDILEMLKNSNCENLEDLSTKFNSINSIPTKLIEMLEISMKKVNLKMKLVLLN